ncbi:hypothetical protein GQ53DRAFT_835364 [Thozetella sp. PMI_491]|nr:hypothetical protein GQ53DRAFT_835364 [Thozetella sp. PMI_491]
MAIRLLTIDDLHKIENYVVELTWMDNFHWFFFPGKWEHSADYRRWWSAYLRDTLLRPDCFVYGVEGANGEILAWAALDTNGIPPVGINLRKDSRRQQRLRRYYAIKTKIMTHLRRNKAADTERLGIWRTAGYPVLKKRMELRDKPGWLGFEIFFAPTLQPVEREEVAEAVLEYGKSQARKAGVLYWQGCTDIEKIELEKRGFSFDARVPVGVVAAVLLVWDAD